MYSLALFRNKGAAELVLEEFGMACAFVQPRSTTDDTEEMVQGLCCAGQAVPVGEEHWQRALEGFG